MSAIQRFAAVCGNGHIATDFLETPVEPGTHTRVPRLCKECSAPVFTSCTTGNWDAPIHGDTMVPGVISMGGEPEADWFCHQCGIPYLWATPEQYREWALNQIRFNEELSDDEAEELFELVAVLSDPEEPNRRETYRSFKERVTAIGEAAEGLQPLVRLFRMVTIGE